MSNPDHLAILKQGVVKWNVWREANQDVRPDLSEADLQGAMLFGANLSGTNLAGANLRIADIGGANLKVANLTGADLTHAFFLETIMLQTNFSDAKGLVDCRHIGPSFIDYRTLEISGQLPEAFLRGCGLPDTLIAYLPSLLNRPIQYYSCFISYSSHDEAFADRLYADLQAAGVRCWFAPEDMKIGDKIRVRIDEAIRHHDKLLLILSVHSVASEWVETEVEGAFLEERRRETTVLFPVRLDDAVTETTKAWASQIRATRHIGDFRQWKDHDAYQTAFKRLLRDLKPELEKKPSPF